MFVWCAIVCSVLAFLALAAGLAKLSGVPQVREMLGHVGAARLSTPIAVIELAAAVGLVVGLFVAPVGVVAAAALVVHFAVATGAHVRVGDPMSQWLNPAFVMVLAALAMWLRLATF